MPAKLREIKKEAVETGYKFDLIIRPDLQIRQRQGQQFQQHHELPTGHATTGTTEQYTTSTEKPVACPNDQSFGTNKGNLPFPGRHLPSHGGHPQDGKRGIRRELNALVYFILFKDFACWR